MPNNNKSIGKPSIPIFAGRPGGGGHRGGGNIMGPVSKAHDTKGTLRRLSSYLIKQKRDLILVFFLVALTTLFNLAGPYLLGLAVDKYLIPQNIDGLITIVALLAITYFFASIGTWLQNYVMIGVSQKSIEQLRKDLFVKLQSLPLGFFDKRPHGELMSRFTNDIENISSTLTQSITQLITSLLTITGIIIVMLFVNWRLALVSFITIPLVYLITNTLAKRTRKAYSKTQKHLGTLNGIIEETITGQKIVKAYGNEREVINNFSQENDSLKTSAIQAETFGGSLGPIMNLINRLGFAVIVGVGSWLTLNGMASVGTIAAFVTYSRQFSRPLNQLAAIYNTIQSALAGAERVFEVLDETPELTDNHDAIYLKDVQGEVTFNDVYFSYNKGIPVLKNINLHANPGQTIALVGPTGSGKTTIINLLTRFYDVDSGKITIDGKNIENIQKDSLRQKLGIVLQDTYFFSGTIKENIRYGRLDATEADIFYAAKMACADQFIHRLPQGYDTILTAEGSNLSQGQRQLLAMARTLLSNPDILILDEATSSVDPRTEFLIQKALLNILKGRTAFIIAHRLRTIRNADVILVISNGEIIERGNHHSLLMDKGFYYELYTSQFKNAL